MTAPRIVWAGALLALASSQGACLMHDVNRDPKPPVELPDAFTAGEDPAAEPGRWWTSFDDGELNQLVDHAIERNLQLKQAWARLAQAEALERMAAAGLFPQVGASLSATRSLSPPRVFNFGGQQSEIPGVESSTFGASVPVSYEVDLWGRVRAGKFAAEQDKVAFRADVETAAMTVAANVTEQWFDILEQRALRRLLEQQIRVNDESLNLTVMRFRESDAQLSDVYQQRQQIQGLEAQLSVAGLREQLAERQLALLLGSTPKNLVSKEREALPPLPPLPQAGIPANMLERRPDLRAAKARVVAADYRIAQAIATRLPQLSLSGNLGLSSTSLSSFFESFVWSITGSLSGTLFDGGRLDAEIDRNEAAFDERMAAYGQALLTALVEVEAALIQERETRGRIDILEGQVRTAQMTLDSARRHFAAGVGSYLGTLTALRSLQLAEQNLLAARRQLLSARVQVYRALGSRWTRELEAPPSEPSDEDRKETNGTKEEAS